MRLFEWRAVREARIDKHLNYYDLSQLTRIKVARLIQIERNVDGEPAEGWEIIRLAAALDVPPHVLTVVPRPGDLRQADGQPVNPESIRHKKKLSNLGGPPYDSARRRDIRQGA
ncbi:MAG: helix-turn-helix domain-containing protein [Rubrobacteraceae bacterium]